MIEYELGLKLNSFLYRDYSADVKRLNSTISKPGKNAELEPTIPPFVYSGNPFSLRPNRCIALFGLNPVWLGPESESTQNEYLLVRRAVDQFRSGDERGLNDYFRIRGDYFDSSSKIYYPNYFSRLGNIIGKYLCGDVPSGPGNEFARSVFRNIIFKTDFLPWCSPNTDGIAWSTASDSQDEALVSYYELIFSFLTTLKPRWIQCNGTQSRPLAERLFQCNFSEESVFSTNGTRRKFLIGETTRPIKVPIIMHPFSNRIANEHFAAMADRFKAFCGTTTFKFD